jgi:hypothetical protein
MGRHDLTEGDWDRIAEAAYKAWQGQLALTCPEDETMAWIALDATARGAWIAAAKEVVWRAKHGFRAENY